MIANLPREVNDMAPQTAIAVPAQNTVKCVTCAAVVPVNEVFDAWELSCARDTCPRCQGLLLDVVTLS
jgi:hypothetical protein